MILTDMATLIARILRRLARAARTDSLDEVDFKSGLGDSSWLLHGLVRALKPDVCVEIGSARGKSTCYIASALQHNQKGVLIAIDPHNTTQWNDDQSVDTLPILRSNLRRFSLERIVTIMQMTSARAAVGWKSPIDLLFIDGDHSFDGVKQDWNLFAPFVKEMGIVVFHDAIWGRRSKTTFQRDDMGVPRFIEQLRLEGYPVLTLENDYGVSMVQCTKGGVKLLDEQETR